MLTGWVAINALVGRAVPGKSAFASTLLIVAESGGGQAFASALLLAAGVCAMMSTVDSALLAFSTMWVRDLFKPYLWRRAPPLAQLVFGKVMALAALCTGVTLAMRTIKTGTPDLSALFSLQVRASWSRVFVCACGCVVHARFGAACGPLQHAGPQMRARRP